MVKFFYAAESSRGLVHHIKVSAAKEKSAMEAIVIKALEQYLKNVGG